MPFKISISLKLIELASFRFSLLAYYKFHKKQCLFKFDLQFGKNAWFELYEKYFDFVITLEL